MEIYLLSGALAMMLLSLLTLIYEIKLYQDNQRAEPSVRGKIIWAIVLSCMILVITLILAVYAFLADPRQAS